MSFPRVWLGSDAIVATAMASRGADILGPRGYAEVPTPADADVIVTGPQTLAQDSSVLAAVRDGAGLVLLSPVAGDVLPAGVEIAAVPPAGLRGLCAAVTEPTAAGLHPQDHAAPQDIAEDLLVRVDVAKLTPTTTFRLNWPALAILRLAGTAGNPGPVVAATSNLGGSRAVVVGVAIDGQSGDLLFNAITYAARRTGSGHTRGTSDIARHPAWLRLKEAVVALRPLQNKDGSVPEARGQARRYVETITAAIDEMSPEFPHDADYLAATVKDLTRWSDADFGVPDFLDSLVAFHPEVDRVDGRRHLVLFPMYTQNGNQDRNVEAVLIEVIWPEFIGDLEAGDYSNKLFVPIRFLDFTPGYDTNSAVLFPETVAMREVPKFSWGAIFADREAARFRSVVTAAADITGLALPPDAARLLADQELAEQTFVMWDLIHDRTHMHGDLPFDPFMIKQRMPYFLYTLEELRCDLTAFRECVKLERQGIPQARLVQYAILFDRIFRFAITGSRVRNYDGLGGQLLFAWLHQHRVLHWTDNRLTIDWDAVTDPILELGRQIEHLYWQSIDRPKTAHWLAAYQLVSGTVTPNPMSTWAKGPQALPLDGPAKGLTDAVLPDEFPLSMFYEALNRKLSPVVSATAGITG